MKTKEQKMYISNYERNNSIVKGLQKRSIDLIKENGLYTLIDGERIYLSNFIRHILVYNTIVKEKYFFGIKREEKEVGEEKGYFSCRLVKLDSLPEPYFIGDLTNYNGYIPKEICEKIAYYQHLIKRSKPKYSYSIQIIDHTYRRFEEFEQPKGDPMVGLVSGNNFYQFGAWAGEASDV